MPGLCPGPPRKPGDREDAGQRVALSLNGRPPVTNVPRGKYIGNLVGNIGLVEQQTGRPSKKKPRRSGASTISTLSPVNGVRERLSPKGAAERCLYRIDHRVQPRVSNLIQTVAANLAQVPY